MRQETSLVSVIVPAYNAARTIARTLLSVVQQTHSALDILVVDDGSTDDTLTIASDFARSDPRIRIIEQRNGGVAAARNVGIAAAGGEIIAPIDADDLWRREKIERQLRALNGAGEETGLVYSWSAVIDAEDRITSLGDQPQYAGDVVTPLAFGNFVGNGSNALMRKRLVQAHGGYDRNLRGQDAQGCEDWKLFIALGNVSHFAVVGDHLTGYRHAATAMSGDVLQMLRSDALVREEVTRRRPEHQLLTRAGRREYIAWLIRRELDAGQWHNVSLLLPEFFNGVESIRGRARGAGRFAVRAALRPLRARRLSVPRLIAYLPEPIAEEDAC